MTEAFWPWMLAIYPKPGVSEALVALQDRERLNVNALLFCCWLAAKHARLSRSNASEIERLSKEWSDAIVAPLRQTRRLLKTSPLITDDKRADIRKRVQGIEIELEELHAKLLAERAASDLGQPVDEPEALAELANDNARAYFAARAIGTADQDRLLGGAEWRAIVKAVNVV